MNEQWGNVPLGSIGEIFDGPHATPTRRDSGDLYFLNISSLESGRLDLELSDRVDEEDFKKWTRRVQPEQDDLLFSYETRLGEAALMPGGVKGCLGRRMALIRPRRDRVDPRFLLYTWLSPQFQDQIRTRAIHGATVSRIPLNELATWEARIPPVESQRAIAEVLGALDDKIAANRRISSTAVSLCESLVHSAAKGRSRSLASLSTVVMGSSPKGEFLNETGEGIAFYQGVRDYGSLFPSPRVFTNSPTRIAEDGDILLAVRAPVGQVNVTRGTTAIGRGLAAVRAHENPVTLFYTLRTYQHEWLNVQDPGTVFSSVNGSTVRDFAVPTVDQEAECLEARLRAIHDRALAAEDENAVLVRTRDELLPLLMDGRISVREAGDRAVADL